MAKITPADIKIRAEDATKAGIASAKKGVGGLTSAVMSYGAEMAAAYLIVKKAISIVKDLTQAYGVQELAVVGMESALRATGKYTPQLSKTLQDLASDLQEVTTYGDEVTLSAISTLQSLADLNEEGIVKTIPLIQDFAAGFKNMGMTMETAASLFGKTLGSTTNALTRYGIVIDMSGTKAERLIQIQEQMTAKFGGRAVALADTYAGKIEMLGNVYGDLQESIGGLMAFGMEPMLPMVTEMVKGIGAWAQKMLELKQEAREFQAIIKEITESGIEQVDSIDNLNAAFEGYKRELKEVDKQQKAYFLTQSMLISGTEMSQAAIDSINEHYAEQKSVIYAAMDAIKEEIKTRRLEQALAEETDARKKGEIERELEAQKIKEAAAKSVLVFYKQLDAAYAQTKQGAIEAKEAEIAHFEAMLLIAENPVIIEKLEYIIKLHKEKIEVLKEEANVYVEEYIDPMMEAEENWAQAQAIHYDAWLEQQENIKIETQELKDAQRQAFQDMATYATMYYDIIDSASAMSFQNKKTELNDWYQTKKAELEAEYTDENELADAIAELDEEMAEKSRQLKIDQAKAEKKMAMLGIVVNTAMAVSKIWGQTGIFGIAAQWPAIAMGIAQLAIVGAQKIPAFQQAGIIGEGYGGGDKQLILGEEGEMMMRKEVVRVNRPALEAMNAGERGMMQVNVYLGTKKIYSDLTKAIRNKQIPLYRGAIID